MDHFSFNYNVGILEDYISVPDCTLLDMTGAGFTLIVAYKDPTEEEIKKIANLKEVRLTKYPDTIWMTFRFDDNHWMDAPFTPYECAEVNFKSEWKEFCTQLEVMLIDTSNGQIKCINEYPFSKDMATAIQDGITEILASPYDRKKRLDHVNEIMQSNKTSQIAEKATAVCLYKDQPYDD